MASYLDFGFDTFLRVKIQKVGVIDAVYIPAISSDVVVDTSSIPVESISEVYLNNDGLKVKDTDATHGLTIQPGSNLTADRVLTLTTGDAARTLDLVASSTGTILRADGTNWVAATASVNLYDFLIAGSYGAYQAAGAIGYSTTDLFSTGGLTAAADDLMVFPVITGFSTRTVEKLAVLVTTSQDPSTVRLGIYNSNSSGYPTTLLLDAGTVSCATAGWKEISVNQILNHNTLYWFAISMSSVATLRLLNLGRANMGILGKATTANDTSHPLTTWAINSANATANGFPASYPASASRGDTGGGNSPVPFFRLT